MNNEKKCYIACLCEARDFIHAKDIDGFVKHIQDGYAKRGRDFELKKFHTLEDVEEVLDFANPYVETRRLSDEDYNKILNATINEEKPGAMDLIYQIYEDHNGDRFICVGYGESGRIEHLNFQQGLDHMDKEILFEENVHLMELLRRVVNQDTKEVCEEEDYIHKAIELYVDAFIFLGDEY